MICILRPAPLSSHPIPVWVHGLRVASDWLHLHAQGSQPWTVQFEARAKWDAWNEVKGMHAEEAKRQYVALLDKVGKVEEAHQPRAVPFGF